MKTKILILTILFSTAIFFSFKINNQTDFYSNASHFKSETNLKSKSPTVAIKGTATKIPGSTVGCKKSPRTCFIKDDEGYIEIYWLAMSGETIIERLEGDLVMTREDEEMTYWSLR